MARPTFPGSKEARHGSGLAPRRNWFPAFHSRPHMFACQLGDVSHRILVGVAVCRKVPASNKNGDRSRDPSPSTRSDTCAPRAPFCRLGGVKGRIGQVEGRGINRSESAHRRAKENWEAANTRARVIAPVIREIRAAGHTSLRGIRWELNRLAVPTVRGGRWRAMTVASSGAAALTAKA
jgi:hypothetical protein